MKAFRWSSLAMPLLWSGLAFGAQGDVEIQQEPIECWPIDQFLLVQSTFVPPEDIQTAKFYFRSTAHLDYYYVELTLGQSGGRGIAPKAQPQTAEVTFYTELVTQSFNAFRTEERTVPVASGSECKRRDPEAAFYTGQNPDIAVGATRLGAAPLPPGFQADGIARFLSATGISGEAGGGGVSGKTIGIIAAIGGGGAAALALSGGGTSETTTSAVGGITTTSVSSSSTSTATGGVTSTTTTIGGGGSSTSSTTTTVGGSTTSVGTSSSTSTTGGGTTTSGTTTSSGGTTSNPTTSNPTTISTTSNPTTSVAGADVRITKRDSKDPVSPNEQFTYDITVTNAGPGSPSVVGVEDQLPSGMNYHGASGAPCLNVGGGLIRCPMGEFIKGNGESKLVRLRVSASSAGTYSNSATVGANLPDPNTGNNTANQNTTVGITLRDSGPGEISLAYRTELQVGATGILRGRIIANDVHSQGIDSSGPHVTSFVARRGENRLEGRIEGLVAKEGHWSFDFAGSAVFVPGSLRVDSGEVLSLDAYSIVFGIREIPAPIRFRFELQDESEPTSRRKRP